MKSKLKRQDLWLLTMWVAIGVFLRFYCLDLKSVWGDEWATLVFSLGHSFRDIPLDRLIDLSTLIEPLRYDSSTPIQAVTEHLFAESNHPPLYYWLTHLWLGLWSQDGEFISIWVGRSPAAFFGVLLIPTTFAVSWFSTRQKLAAHFAAIAMAVSPYAVYLSQEARHYTLAMLWITLSYGCVAQIIQDQQQRKIVSFKLIAAWIVVNSLGIASHYFMVLCLFAEGLVLLFFYAEEITYSWRKLPAIKHIFLPHWYRIIGGLLASWLSFYLLMSQWSSDSNGELTSWLNQDYGWSLDVLLPPLRSLAWLLGMIFMLPVEASQTWLVVLSAIALFLILIWFIPKATTALKHTWSQLETRIFSSLILANLCTLLGIVYLLKLDLSLAPRYHFTYFPAVILLLSILSANFWQPVENNQIALKFWQRSNKQTAIILVSLMLISSLSVNFDLAYRKPEDSKAIAQKVLRDLEDQQPAILSTHYYEIAVIRTQIGLAWELHNLNSTFAQQFLLLDNFRAKNKPAQILKKVVDNLSEPTKILMFNTHFQPPPAQCPRQSDEKIRAIGYSYYSYLCEQKKKPAKQTQNN
ncbi:MAG: glycosyltransferase family 39 protein [Limnothrix sp.]